jgi:hypothetical protein
MLLGLVVSDGMALAVVVFMAKFKCFHEETIILSRIFSGLGRREGIMENLHRSMNLALLIIF